MSLVNLYKTHLTRLVDYYKGYLNQHNLEAAWVHYGNHDYFFNDDQEKNFRANPFAVHLINEPNAVGSYIKISKEGEVTLYNFQDLGYWNVPINLDFSLFEESGLVKVVRFGNAEKDLYPLISASAANSVLITPNGVEFGKSLGFKAEAVNDCELILDLEELRLVKTEYEYEMLCQAQFYAIKAHRALKAAVLATDLSENQLLGLYLQAANLPADKQGYQSIIAYNRHAAILHYNQLDFNAPTEKKSFLVDAGAVYKGYQADLTRTYCLDGNQLFSDLIVGVGNIKDEIIAQMRPGVTTVDLQNFMQRKTAELLIDAEVIKGCSVEQAFDLKIPQHFLPHGFGHSMGIGVHDVVGRPKLPKAENVRASHELTVGNVWTVEPGIYFIDELIAKLAENPETKQHLDFDLIAELHPYGGIRVEDNVMLEETQLVNFTAELENY